MSSIYIVYRKKMFFTDRILQSFGGGRFLHCEVFVPQYNQVFALFWGHKPQMRTDLSTLYGEMPEFFYYHKIDLDSDEFSAFMNSQISFVEHRNSYNMSDIFLQLLPTNLTETFCTDVSTSEKNCKLFCSQAIWLSLRKAITDTSRNKAFKPFLDQYNSRLLTPTHMSEIITKILHKEPISMSLGLKK